MAATAQPMVNDKREIFGWAMFDWAISAFSTTVITVFLGPYLTSITKAAADANGIVFLLGVPIPIRTKLVPAYILGCLAISFACFPPGVYGYSEPPPTRTMIIPLFFLVGGMLCAFFLTGWILAERDGTTWLRSILPVVLSLLALGFSVTVTALGLFNARLYRVC